VVELYVESFKGSDHLHRIQKEALAVIQNVIRDGES
jgi:phosphoglucomutase